MTTAKRLLDITLALALLVLLAIPFGILVIYLLIKEGRPVFYVSERMRGPDRPFMLWKLRTMRPAPEDSGVSGGDKADRVTPLGKRLRKHRLDEIPQLWNVLRGDMSFVGPRPPLRSYVKRFPELYAEVLRSRPGITGMATIYFHRREEQLLQRCTTAEETHRVYVTRCVPPKARLDLIYQRRRNLCLDISLMLKTVQRVAGFDRKVGRSRVNSCNSGR
jgi:lipopolysaccharide/colanic/teichoic acid biosynthesis glycosyltransferase